MADQILPKETPVSTAPETAQENGQEVVQKLTSRELIAVKLKILAVPEAGDNEDSKLRNRGLAESLRDIDAALAPEVDGEKLQEPTKLDLISAYQGLKEIKKSYGEDADVDTIQQTVLEKLKKEHSVKEEELDYLDLDTALEAAYTSANKAELENKSGEMTLATEQYFEQKAEIDTLRNEIKWEAKKFYTEVSKKTADRLVPYFSAIGGKIDEALAALPDIAIIRAAKNFGEEGKMTAFSRRAALATGALAGLAFFAGHPGTIEAASQMESALTGGDTLHPVHTEATAVHEQTAHDESIVYETGSAENITQEIPHEASSSPKEVIPAISDLQSQQEKIESQHQDNEDQIISQESNPVEENSAIEQTVNESHSVLENFLKQEKHDPGEVLKLFTSEAWETLNQDAKTNFILKATESPNDFWKPEMAITFLHEYINHPLAKQILEKAVERGAPASEYIDMFAGMPWAKDILKAEINKFDEDYIVFWTRRIESSALSSEQKTELVSYVNEKFPPPTLEQAYDKFHHATEAQAKGRFSNLVWPRLAEETRSALIDKIMETNTLAGADILFDNFNDLKEAPKLREWLKGIEDSAPEILVNKFDLYSHLPWANEVARGAIKKAPPEITISNPSLMRVDRLNFWVKDTLEHAYPGSIDFLSLYKHGEKFSYKLFSNDPALQMAVKVNRDWIPDSDVDKNNNRDTMQQRLLVARNLYFNGVTEVTHEAVKEASHEIVEMREKYKDVPLFEGRNVLVAAHGENEILDRFTQPKAQWRFGKQALLEEIKEQQYGGDAPATENALRLILERPGKYITRDEVVKVKERVLDSIRTLPNLTFLFDGHGSPVGLFFAEGEADSLTRKQPEWNHISPEELAKAFIDRYHNLPSEHDDPAKKPIMILASCYNANYLRNFYALLEKAHIPKPISLGESEFGQFGYSDFSLAEGSKFLKETILQPGAAKSTIGGVIERDSKVPDTNPSLFIPGPGNRLMQISERQDDGSPAAV